MPKARCFSKWGLARSKAAWLSNTNSPPRLWIMLVSPRLADSLSQAGMARRCKDTSASTDRSRFDGREASTSRASQGRIGSR